MANIRPALMSYAEKHPGRMLYPADVADEMGETQERVSAGLSNLMRDMPEFPLTRVSRGVYVYRPNRDGHKTAKIIGQASSGVVIFETDDGKLYRGEEIS